MLRTVPRLSKIFKEGRIYPFTSHVTIHPYRIYQKRKAASKIAVRIAAYESIKKCCSKNILYLCIVQEKSRMQIQTTSGGDLAAQRPPFCFHNKRFRFA